ncbi:MAG: hypothetical protein LQ338_000871 [Usnochroma carphineum]|nr:MAG: hypothetical protein LQ338_000871 [Usnochroma carphineum]
MPTFPRSEKTLQSTTSQSTLQSSSDAFEAQIRDMLTRPATQQHTQSSPSDASFHPHLQPVPETPPPAGQIVGSPIRPRPQTETLVHAQDMSSTLHQRGKADKSTYRKDDFFKREDMTGELSGPMDASLPYTMKAQRRFQRPQHPPGVPIGQSHHPSPAVPRQWIQPAMPPNSACGRPPPRHPQLYVNVTTQAAVQAQNAYLGAIARKEVPKAMIQPDEEERKELMRRTLEDVCQMVITEHEVERDPLFDGSTVSLKCYGSLRTGFATHSSDMDLALESPHSKPVISSAESEIPRLLEKALLDLGYGARLLTRTRMPLIKFCQKPTPELAVRLREERNKWEKQKDVPAETLKAPLTKDGKADMSQPSEQKDETISNDNGVQGESPQGGVILSDPLDGPKNTKGPSSLPMHSRDPLQGPTTAQSPRPLDSAANEQTDAGKAPTDGNRMSLKHLSLADEDDVVADSQDGPDTAITADAALESPASTAQSSQVQTEKTSTPTVAKERRENVLPNNELVRLYKLAMKEGWFEPEERKTIFAFFKAVESDNADDQVAERRAQLLSLPDVLNRYRPAPEHLLDFPKDGVGVQCDIIFSNPLAIHNSSMLRCYNLCDPRVKPMVMFVKAWAKRRKINSPYHGTLSSYGYVLMVLHYLVNVAQPPICPNLQTTDMALRDTSYENTQIIEGHGVRFWRNEEVIQQWARQGYITEDRQSTVGSLLRGFFQYFATPPGGFSWAMEVLSLRTPGGILTKKQKGWIAAKTEVMDPAVEGQKGQEVRQRYLFAIEDPFETNHNIARTVVHNGIVAIRDEFRRANRLIHQAGNGQVMEDLFAEAESKDDLNYRHFGPRPRPTNGKAPVQGIPGQQSANSIADNGHSASDGHG